jgi:peptidoglycan/LPS O-acetylase OafA/YrhL
MYVLHPFAVLLAAAWVSDAAFPVVFGTALAGRLIFILVAGSLTVAMAFGSWHLFEKHFLKLKRLFPYGRAGTATACGSGAGDAAATEATR